METAEWRRQFPGLRFKATHPDLRRVAAELSRCQRGMRLRPLLRRSPRALDSIAEGLRSWNQLAQEVSSHDRRKRAKNTARQRAGVVSRHP